MLYNFTAGPTALLLGEWMRKSFHEHDPKNYPLSDCELESENGFYIVKEPGGGWHRVGFYLTHYNDEVWSKTPSLHIDFCDNVLAMKERMRATNTHIVTYKSRDSLRIYNDVPLNICYKCLKLFKEKISFNGHGMTFQDFILEMEENDAYRCKEIDENGYTLNFSQVSKYYRESKNYTCEKCGYKPKDSSHYHYMHTHHIRGHEKTNNKRSNLMCLCIQCHASVDEHHSQMFATESKALQLLQFTYHKNSV